MKKHRLLHQEIGVSPLTLGIVHRGFHHHLHLKYTKPIHFENSICAYHDYKCDWYLQAENFRNFGFKIIENAKKDLSFRDRLLKDTIFVGDSLLSLSRKINKADLNILPRVKLIKYLNTLYNLGSDLCDLGAVAAAPDVAFGNFSKILKEIIKEKVKLYKLKRNVNEYFNILTSSGKGSLVQKESYEILKLSLEISNNRKLIKIIRSKSEQDLEVILSQKYKNIFSKIIRIKNKYGWLYFGHLGPAKSTSEYLADLKNNILAGGIVKALELIKEESRELKKKQGLYAKELKLNKEEREIFKTAQNFSYNKAYRYDVLLYTYFTLDKLLRQISKKTYVSLNDLHFLSLEEIIDLLKNKKKLNHQEVQERRKFCISIISGKGLKFLTGKQAKKYLKDKVIIEKRKKELKIIHGTSAYLGRVSGKVKIIESVKDIDKVKEGDILIATQTTPELVPAMKIAAAFITDIGGITSHAAIIAREMKKPCIIGTKIASKIFKDNEMVEVNANEGDIIKL